MTNERFMPSSSNPEIANNYARLLKRILHHEDTIQRLESGLEAFSVRIKVAEKSGAASASLARELFEKATRILSMIKANPDQTFVVPALAAIDYLVTESDGLPDFGSDAGFEDDSAVLNQVIAHFRILE